MSKQRCVTFMAKRGRFAALRRTAEIFAAVCATFAACRASEPATGAAGASSPGKGTQECRGPAARTPSQVNRKSLFLPADVAVTDAD